jgi:hypothetical protein
MLRDANADVIAVPVEEVYSATGLRDHVAEAAVYAIAFLHGQSEVLDIGGATESELLTAVLRHAAQAAPDDPQYQNLLGEWLYEAMLPLPFVALADALVGPILADMPEDSLPVERLAETVRRITALKSQALAALRGVVEANFSISWVELEPLFAPEARREP